MAQKWDDDSGNAQSGSWKVKGFEGLTGKAGESLRFGDGPRRFDQQSRVGVETLLGGPVGQRSVRTSPGLATGAVGARNRLRARVQSVDDLVTLFVEFRYRGVEPHPFFDTDDAEVASWLWDAIDHSEDAVSLAEGGDANVDPHPSLGLTNPSLTYSSDVSSPRSDTQYGQVHQIIGDVARAGIGVIRHLNDADISWDRICWRSDPETDRIVPPWEMNDHVLGDDCANMARFTWPLICGWWFGVQIIGLLFNTGGGSPFGTRSLLTNSQGDTYTWEDIEAGRPTHQRYLTVPAGDGWHDWYWYDHSPGSATVYQGFGLNIYPTVTDDGASLYDAECARRKCLGVAAYAAAVADYLQLIDATMSGYGVGLEEVLPGLEYSNEMDHYWGGPALPDNPAGREYGRYMALLGGPIQQAFGSRIRFHFSDLLGWVGTENHWEQALVWLQASAGIGLPAECNRLQRFWSEEGVKDHAQDWAATIAAQDELTYWPPRVWSSKEPAPSLLLHQVGLHFFHQTDFYANVGSSGWFDNYRDEVQLGEELDQLFEKLDSLAGLELAWTMGAIGFPAELPLVPDHIPSKTNPGDQYYGGTTPKYQAGMVVRRLLYSLARGAKTAFQYTHMATLADQTKQEGQTEQQDGKWLMLASSGIRNDAFNPWASGEDWHNPADSEDFLQEDHAWRRPAWYSVRRLAWLLHQTGMIEPIFADNARGVALRLTAIERYASTFDGVLATSSQLRPGEETPIQAGRYALIAWQDELRCTSGDDLRLELSKLATQSWRLLSLIPDVDPSTTTPADRLNYPEGELVDWSGGRNDGGGWTTATVTRTATLEVTVPRADPEENPAPLCLLLDVRPSPTFIGSGLSTYSLPIGSANERADPQRKQVAGSGPLGTSANQGQKDAPQTR